MDSPPELSLAEIHKFMIKHDCKVTNHALVKHFKKFLKNPVTENEARKQFKTYVNILATVVNEKNQKYLLLREKYLYDCPSEDIVNRISSVPSSPGNISINSEVFGSPFRQPPPYKPPPQVLQKETQQNYRDCISEFQAAVRHIDPNRMPINDDLVQQLEQSENFGEISEPPTLPPRKSSTVDQAIVISRNNFHEEENKENVNELLANDPMPNVENQMSVKEATRKFNRMASEEEAKVISPQSKKKPEKEKVLIEDKADDVPEVTISHPKAKEWLVAAAKANYQELAKLGLDYPELARLHDPTTGYTALHWAAKHGNEDVCKLIAGTYKANINARTNGGYTPLHLAMQFGRENIFELLCNVYKANRDITDWSGNKPLDYSKQRTTVSASTYSKIKARKKHIEKDSGFLRIGSLNVRVKKTTEAFSNFLGVGSGSNNSNNYQQQTGMIMPPPTTVMRNPTDLLTNNGIQRSSVPPPLLKNKQFDKMHKNWGSVDNIQKPKDLMPPPIKNLGIKKRKSKHISNDSNNIPVGYDSTGYSSMPTTPNQIRASPIGVLNEKDSDSDTACGFDSNWTGGNNNRQKNTPTYI